MMKKEKICPVCGNPYSGHPAVSRFIDRLICSDCGTREALESLGLSEKEQEKIIATIHRARG